jgi:hypothetical protein
VGGGGGGRCDEKKKERSDERSSGFFINLKSINSTLNQSNDEMETRQKTLLGSFRLHQTASE